jgi:hypothetical protein
MQECCRTRMTSRWWCLPTLLTSNLKTNRGHCTTAGA